MTHTIHLTQTRSLRKYHSIDEKPQRGSIFVFASNSRGFHKTLNALEAVEKHGAEMYIGCGASGNSFAIPMWDSNERPLRYSAYSTHVQQFIDYATINNNKVFWVTDVGGAIGIPKNIINDLFSEAPLNCIFPSSWRKTY